MAIGAEQDTLVQFMTNVLTRPILSFADSESFCRAVKMMKVKGCDRTRITTTPTTTAHVLHCSSLVITIAFFRSLIKAHTAFTVRVLTLCVEVVKGFFLFTGGADFGTFLLCSIFQRSRIMRAKW
jgi:hypothetical protein